METRQSRKNSEKIGKNRNKSAGFSAAAKCRNSEKSEKSEKLGKTRKKSERFGKIRIYSDLIARKGVRGGGLDVCAAVQHWKELYINQLIASKENVATHRLPK